ncbi:uncharacterized protein N7473_006824 [Penicillium subrubescens]|jgi:hypothetical protein|uniref:Uncharacterized protein n=1 Tax=Penicillium subrubescens TaxID=1316194 RepID=A0A1Q5ULE3_9EURO|nr:uncharacterized protein N7473_006824 [Penicillium subrubescens]KAJ5890596.1 hypothetical protein N7473_006824 [Penicillium subrubescens]OKP13292.1 hypothetical protein PENSUB_1023 [Penicillium subrubescens]
MYQKRKRKNERRLTLLTPVTWIVGSSRRTQWHLQVGFAGPAKRALEKAETGKLPGQARRAQLKLPMIDDMDTEAVDPFVWTQVLARLRAPQLDRRGNQKKQ